MLMPTDSFAAVFAFSFAMAIGAVLSPGPVTTAIISQSPRLGWVAGPLVSIGHAIIELLMVVLITLGLSSVLGAPLAQTLIAILGGLLLLWMGGGMLLDAVKGKSRLPQGDQNQARMDYPRMLTLGMAASITNPFWYAWWMTAAAAYLLQAKAVGWLPVAGFYLGHISADFLWNTILSAVVGSGRKFITDRVYGALISVCSLFLIYLAVRFLLAGISGMAG